MEEAKTGSYMIPGVIYEFIAIPCGHAYTTPIGVIWGDSPRIRVYKTTRLYNILSRARKGVDIVMYSPVYPEDFALSVTHELDKLIDDDCTPPRPYMVLFKCKAYVEEYFDEYLEARCEGTLKPGVPVPYTRLYGGLVEALVIASKAGAGVISTEEARACLHCSLWAARRGGRSRVVALQGILQAAFERLLGTTGIVDKLHEPNRASNGLPEVEGGMEGR